MSIPDASQTLMDEFGSEFDMQASVRSFTIAGLHELAKKLPAPLPENPDPMIFIGEGDPNKDGTVPDGWWRQSQLVDAIDKVGWLNTWLSDAWITLIFARWECHYRPEFARLFDADLDQIVSPVMGDLRHMRHDIAHHRGMASRDRTGTKCEIITRFRTGDRIVLTADDIRQLRNRLNVDCAS
jgi:hypothetical protein